MLSDMIDDLVWADCPQEKEAAYRQLEKLGVDRTTADVIARSGSSWMLSISTGMT